MSAQSIQDQLSATILEVLHSAKATGLLNCEIPAEVTLERPKNRDHGDYATSIALALAKPAGKNPREVAQILIDGLTGNKDIASLDIAGPGFVNITLAKASQGAVVHSILQQANKYGHGNSLNGVAINL